jgi:hypothetical protein
VIKATKDYVRICCDRCEQTPDCVPTFTTKYAASEWLKQEREAPAVFHFGRTIGLMYCPACVEKIISEWAARVRERERETATATQSRRRRVNKGGVV